MILMTYITLVIKDIEEVILEGMVEDLLENVGVNLLIGEEKKTKKNTH